MGLDTQDDQIALAIAVEDFDDLELAVVGQGHQDLGVAGDDVQVARHQPVVADDETRAERVLGADRDDCWRRASGNFGGRMHYRRIFRWCRCRASWSHSWARAAR